MKAVWLRDEMKIRMIWVNSWFPPCKLTAGELRTIIQRHRWRHG